jgi:hypothetical protein
VDPTKRSERFLCGRVFYISISVLPPFFSSVFCTLSVRFLCVFYFDWPRLWSCRGEISWRPSAGASEVALPFPQRNFYVFDLFLYVFYYSKAVAHFWEKYVSLWGRSGGMMEKDIVSCKFPTRFSYVFVFRFSYIVLEFFSCFQL